MTNNLALLIVLSFSLSIPLAAMDSKGPAGSRAGDAVGAAASAAAAGAPTPPPGLTYDQAKAWEIEWAMDKIMCSNGPLMGPIRKILYDIGEAFSYLWVCVVGDEPDAATAVVAQHASSVIAEQQIALDKLIDAEGTKELLAKADAQEKYALQVVQDQAKKFSRVDMLLGASGAALLYGLYQTKPKEVVSNSIEIWRKGRLVHRAHPDMPKRFVPLIASAAAPLATKLLPWAVGTIGVAYLWYQLKHLILDPEKRKWKEKFREFTDAALKRDAELRKGLEQWQGKQVRELQAIQQDLTKQVTTGHKRNEHDVTQLRANVLHHQGEVDRQVEALNKQHDQEMRALQERMAKKFDQLSSDLITKHKTLVAQTEKEAQGTRTNITEIQLQMDTSLAALKQQVQKALAEEQTQLTAANEQRRKEQEALQADVQRQLAAAAASNAQLQTSVVSIAGGMKDQLGAITADVAAHGKATADLRLAVDTAVAKIENVDKRSEAFVGYSGAIQRLALHVGRQAKELETTTATNAAVIQYLSKRKGAEFTKHLPAPAAGTSGAGATAPAKK